MSSRIITLFMDVLCWRQVYRIIRTGNFHDTTLHGVILCSLWNEDEGTLLYCTLVKTLTNTDGTHMEYSAHLHVLISPQAMTVFHLVGCGAD